MDLKTAIKSRRSVKHFDPSIKMSDNEFAQLIAQTMLSPTSYNIQHWRFLRVTDPSLRAAFKEAAWGQEQVQDASELIVLCADLNAWQKQPERYWANAPSETQSLMVQMLTDFYAGKPQLQRDEAIRSCGIAAQTMMLSATAMGWDTGALVGFDPEKAARLIHLPDDYVIGMLIVIGKARKAAKPRGGQLPMEALLFENSF